MSTRFADVARRMSGQLLQAARCLSWRHRAGNPPNSRLFENYGIELADKYPGYSAVGVRRAEPNAAASSHPNPMTHPRRRTGVHRPPVKWERWHQPYIENERAITGITALPSGPTLGDPLLTMMPTGK